jgi:Ca-activated chloride channel homolog
LSHLKRINVSATKGIQMTAMPNPALLGSTLISLDGRTLPLIDVKITAHVSGGVVRAQLKQTFRNPYSEILHCHYQLPLPADGAVSGFSFQMNGNVIKGNVLPKQRAREQFEEAIVSGRTAAILDENRSSVFHQEIGNIPSLSQIVCTIEIDQKLQFLPDAQWEWRFPTVLGPKYENASSTSAAQNSVTATQEDLGVRVDLELNVDEQNISPKSPSHTLHTKHQQGVTHILFADDRGSELNKEIVIRWPASANSLAAKLANFVSDSPGLRGQRFGLITLTPPVSAMPSLSRDLIILLDTSGSMNGAPLEQSKRMASILVDGLSDSDTLEIIEFSTSPRKWKRQAVSATPENRRDAQGFIARLQASGGTEMRTGIIDALAALRSESQRQVILVTDGLIGFENEVLKEISQKLPSGSRLHVVGVGSSINRSLTRPAAQAGRGVELVLSLKDNADAVANRLLQRLVAPVLTDITVSGSALVAAVSPRLNDVFQGSPSLISLQLKPEGGHLEIRGRTFDGEFAQYFEIKNEYQNESSNPALATLFAREKVEYLELETALGNRVDAQIEKLGVDFQISTRLTSWVAISETQTVDSTKVTRRELMPQAVPEGMNAETSGLRSAASFASPVMSVSAPRGRMAASPARASMPSAPKMQEMAKSKKMESESKSDSGSVDRLERAQSIEQSPMDDAGFEAEESSYAFAEKKAPAPAAPASGAVRRESADKSSVRSEPLAQIVYTFRVLKFQYLKDLVLVEFDCAHTFNWKHPVQITVQFSDGTTQIVALDASKTTAAHEISIGLLVRLAMQISNARNMGLTPRKIESIFLDFGDAKAHLDVSALS